MQKINSPKELAAAVNARQDTIVIEGDLAGKVIRIKLTGNIAWGIAIGAIGLSVVAILATPVTGGASNAAHFITAPAAVAILGGGPTVAAISIAVAAGGVSILNQLRAYSIVEQTADYVVLKLK